MGKQKLIKNKKLHLIEYLDDIWWLDKRSEFFNHRRYQNKPLLKSLKRKENIYML